jgi:hypothetical protein
MFPVNITNIFAAGDDLPSAGCVATVEDLLSLKELVDDISRLRDV